MQTDYMVFSCQIPHPPGHSSNILTDSHNHTPGEQMDLHQMNSLGVRSRSQGTALITGVGAGIDLDYRFEIQEGVRDIGDPDDPNPGSLLQFE